MGDNLARIAFARGGLHPAANAGAINKNTFLAELFAHACKACIDAIIIGDIDLSKGAA